MKLAAIALLCLSSSAFAGSWDIQPNELTLQGGADKGTQRYAVGLVTKPLYKNGNFTINPTFELADVHRGNEITQFTAVPMLRYDFPKTGLYIEGGVGASLTSSTHLGNKDLATGFLFSDNIGFGYHITKRIEIAYRLSHYSNADIKTPNPGFEMQSVVFGVKF